VTSGSHRLRSVGSLSAKTPYPGTIRPIRASLPVRFADAAVNLPEAALLVVRDHASYPSAMWKDEA
jgi:hypothetical protein